MGLWSCGVVEYEKNLFPIFLMKLHSDQVLCSALNWAELPPTFFGSFLNIPQPPDTTTTPIFHPEKKSTNKNLVFVQQQKNAAHKKLLK